MPFVAGYYIRGLGLGVGVGLGLPPGLGLGVGSPGVGLGVGSPGVGLGIGLGSGLPPGLGLGVGIGLWLGIVDGVVDGFATSVPVAVPLPAVLDVVNVHCCVAPAIGDKVSLLPLFLPRNESHRRTCSRHLQSDSGVSSRLRRDDPPTLAVGSSKLVSRNRQRGITRQAEQRRN